jgi:hypothetical protein
MAFEAVDRVPRSRGRRREWNGVAAAKIVLAAYGTVAGCTAFAFAAAERPSFLSPPTIHGDPPWLAGPLAGRWPALPTAIATREWGATWVLVGMTGCWLLVVACARRIGLAAVLVAALGGITMLTLAPPFSLTDTFNYLHYGRMEALYGLNPYTHVPADAGGGGPAYRWTTWHHREARTARSSCWRWRPSRRSGWQPRIGR